MNALDFLYLPIAVVTAPWWATKKRSGWKERFGHVPNLGAPAEAKRGRIQLHAVSVGEVAALRHLVPLLLEEAEVVVSATTDTGIKRANELYGLLPGCTVVRYPLDFSRSTARFLDAVAPDVVGLVELEVWPNFVRECSDRKIPVCVINGRLSERSAGGYRRIRGFFSRTMGRLRWAAVQEEAYAKRFIELGVPTERCKVTGSMKWDAAKIEDHVQGAAELGSELGIDPSRPLIVAGSTGPDEEALLHEACPPGVQLLCAPRKPERFNEAAAALGDGLIRRTQRRIGPVKSDRFLLDTIGELRKAYALATVVVVGRSFGALYGSDPIEPVALGKPVVIGRSVSDFATVVSAFVGSGGIVQADSQTLAGVLADLLANPERCRAMAEAGQRCILGQQGASERHARLLLGELNPSVRSGKPGHKRASGK